MTATIQNIFTRTQFILLASLLALVFSFSFTAEAASVVDLAITPSDSSIEWMGEKGVTYSFYFDGSKTETKLKEGKSVFATLGKKRGTFTLTSGLHTVIAAGKDAKGVVVSTSAPTAFFAGFDVPKPNVGIPAGESSSRNIYPFTAKAVSSTQIDLMFNCTVPNADHNCKIYQDGKLIKTFEVKKNDYGRYTAYSVKNLTPNTKYSFVVVEYAKKGSLPDKPRVNTYMYTPTLAHKTPVPVTIPPTILKISIISPNGGETYKAGDEITLWWQQNYDAKNMTISVFNNVTGKEIYNNVNVLGMNGGKNGITIPSSGTKGVAEGKYRFTVCDDAKSNPTVPGKPLCDVSDGEFFIASPSAPGDKTAPTTPGFLTVTVNSSTQVTLTWGASSDIGLGMAYYQIERSDINTGKALAVVPASTTMFVDKTVGATTTYTYYVTAVDKAGNVSKSVIASVRLPAVPPTCPTNACSEKLSLKPSNDDPDAMTIVLDSKSTTDAEIFAFDLSALDSESDITVSQIGITVAVAGVTSLNEIVNAFHLDINGKSYYANAYVGTGRTAKLVFSEVGTDKILKGKKVTAALVGQFKAKTTIPQGVMIAASLSPADITAKGPKNMIPVNGLVLTSDKHTLALAGVALGAITDGTGSSDSTQVVSGVNVDANYGTMFLDFDITPFGDDMFVKANSASRGASPTAALSYVIEDINGVVVPSGTVSVTYSIDGATLENGYFHLEEGNGYTMNVTINSFNPVLTGTYRLHVLAVGASAVPGGTVALAMPSEYQSDSVAIQSGPGIPPTSCVGSGCSAPPIIVQATFSAVAELGGTSETINTNGTADTSDDYGTYGLKFDVTAIDDDIFIPMSVVRGTALGTGGANFLVTSSGTPTTAGVFAATLTSNATQVGNRYKVLEGESRTFTLSVTYRPEVFGAYKVQMYSLNLGGTETGVLKQQVLLPKEDFTSRMLQFGSKTAPTSKPVTVKTSVPLTSAETTTKIATLTALMNKLVELKAMMASVNMSR